MESITAPRRPHLAHAVSLHITSTSSSFRNYLFHSQLLYFGNARKGRVDQSAWPSSFPDGGDGNKLFENQLSLLFCYMR